MSGVIESLERAQLKRVPDFQAGDRVKVGFVRRGGVNQALVIHAQR